MSTTAASPTTPCTALAVTAPYNAALQSCPTNEDWFGVTVASGDAIDVDATFTHAEGNIDVYILDSGPNIVATGASTSDDEDISYTATAAGTYYVFVEMVNDTGSLPSNAYTLDVTTTTGGGGTTCVEDALEDDTQATATLLSPPSTDPTQSCLGDDDWFEVSLAAGETVDLDVLFTHAEGNIDVFLFDSTGAQVNDGQSTSDDELITYIVHRRDLRSAGRPHRRPGHLARQQLRRLRNHSRRRWLHRRRQRAQRQPLGSFGIQRPTTRACRSARRTRTG